MKLSKELSRPEKREAIRNLKKAKKKTKNARMQERYLILIMVLSGKEYEEIAKLTGRSKGTIVNYVKAYRKGGIEGLNMKPYKGRAPKLNPDQEMYLSHILAEKTPKDVGFPAQMNWTAPIVRSFIKMRFGVEYSERGTRDLLYRLNFSFTAPTYTLAKADPQKQEEFKKKFEELKKNSSMKK